MTPAEFEEKEYEAPLYHQLELGSQFLWSPGQVLENHLGFDRGVLLAEAYLFKLHGHQGPLHGVTVNRFMWPMLPSKNEHRIPPFRINCFIQSKRCEIGKRLSPHLSALGSARPFYRFKVEPKQQSTLNAAADQLRDRALFIYAAPVFASARELFRHMSAGTVMDNSTFPNVATLNGHQNWYYNSPGAKGVPNEGRDYVDDGSLDSRIETLMERSGDSANFQDDTVSRNLEELAVRLRSLSAIPSLSQEPRIAYLAMAWRDIDQFSEGNELRPDIANYLRIQAFAAYCNLRWFTVT